MNFIRVWYYHINMRKNTRQKCQVWSKLSSDLFKQKKQVFNCTSFYAKGCQQVCQMGYLIWSQQHVDTAHLPIQFQLMSQERKRDGSIWENGCILMGYQFTWEYNTHLWSRQHVILFDLDSGFNKTRAASYEQWLRRRTGSGLQGLGLLILILILIPILIFFLLLSLSFTSCCWIWMFLLRMTLKRKKNNNIF